MENSFQTSFIPKKSVVTTTNTSAPRSSRSLLTIISVLILIIIGITAGGLFLYKNYLTNQRAVLSTSIVKVGDNFDRDTIAQLQQFDKRMSAAKTILTSHIVFSPLFNLIGQVTIPSVQYTKFTEQTTASDFTVSMSGVALDYQSVAVQADVFNGSKGRYFKNVVFSNLVRDNTTNYVSFDLDFSVDPSLVSYEKNNLLDQSQVPATTTTPTTPATSAPTSEVTVPPATTTTTPDSSGTTSTSASNPTTQ